MASSLSALLSLPCDLGSLFGGAGRVLAGLPRSWAISIGTKVGNVGYNLPYRMIQIQHHLCDSILRVVCIEVQVGGQNEL